jgi:release factor glutamine methyltransferase
LRIQEALKKYHKIEIELLLAHVLGKPKEFLYLNWEKKLSGYQVSSLTSLIKRREKGEPLAYILGYKDFFGLRFKVNRNVLVPRPETEWIVERLKDLRLKDCKKPVRILDIGTGSGAIAISLAKIIGQRSKVKCQMFASDISPAALKVAKQNAKVHHADIKFIHSDLFTKINGKFDVVIANLPYVPKTDYRLKIKDLRWEPKMALVDPVKDFNIYERFFKQAKHHLNKNAVIYLEIDPKTKPYIQKWAKKYLPEADVKFFKDYGNFWRFAEIKTY